ncbi:MAG: N-acetyltransferase family protein [Haloarculaceae archaeon]
MSRSYPDEPAGPFEPPPLSFTDAEGRTIDVRSIDESDVEALVSMYVAFDPADRAQGIPPGEEARIRDWLDALLGEDAINVAAWHDDDVIGHALLVPDGEESYELAIFVLGSYQEAGIGTRLIEALLGQGQQAGVERVWLTVERWNDAAIHLYRKVGFESAERGSFEMEMAARLH